MKRAYIVHGLQASPQSNWFPWLKGELEAQGWKVTVPAMPDPEHPDREAWLSTLQATIEPDQDTLLIGHSLGCITILHYLESLTTYQVGQAILVAGFMHKLNNPLTDGFFDTPADPANITTHVAQIDAFYSEDDPHVPPHEALFLGEALGATLHKLDGAGHINAAAGFTEFQQILPVIRQ